MKTLSKDAALLKNIAGLITKLPYMEMKRLADMIGTATGTGMDTEGKIANALIKVSEEILSDEPLINKGETLR